MVPIEDKVDFAPTTATEDETPLRSDSPFGLRKIHTFDTSSHVDVPYPFSPKRLRNRAFMSLYIVLFKAKINVLLPFGPLAIVLHYITGKHGWVFFFSLLGITPLAERLGYATEQLAFYTGPTVGGLLNATFGNATEMIISLYALKHGMIRVIQQSLLGSILSNMLLVLGCAFFTGGIVHRNKVQVFDKYIAIEVEFSSRQAAAVVNSGLLLMAVMGLMFPAVLHFTHSEVHFGKSELSLSRFSSCIMLVAYASYLYFQLKSQPNLYRPAPVEEDGDHKEEDSDEEEIPEITQWEAIGWLAVLTLWISVISGYLVDAIQGASDSWNMPVAFISVILLPIVGNAAEHASAIMFAMKDKLDITLGVAIGSSTQISMFVIPFCVVVGWFMGKPMDLNFQLFETATLFITVLVVAFMLQEGTANYFKGLMLILCYLIVAASFFVHIDPPKSFVVIFVRLVEHTSTEACAIPASLSRGLHFLGFGVKRNAYASPHSLSRLGARKKTQACSHRSLHILSDDAYSIQSSNVWDNILLAQSPAMKEDSEVEGEDEAYQKLSRNWSVLKSTPELQKSKMSDIFQCFHIQISRGDLRKFYSDLSGWSSGNSEEKNNTVGNVVKLIK
ncbi:hypothetical protein IFM89_039674 [Coptis chinensis]|uniref:Vacuolar cation/proton exchanger n=1 Tax=Coptis chinensis TaxID=261450 RepID=A0A835GTP2_9MAGN|nr:hypothetical protein IFM89_039674 [Coptis chinensis]